MKPLYRMVAVVPTLAALLLGGCGGEAPPAETRAPASNVYVEALNETREAQRASDDALDRQSRRLDELRGDGQ